MDPLTAALVLFGPLAIVGGVAAFRLAAMSKRQEAPLVPVAELKQDAWVRVRGEAACDEPTEAPLSGRECAYWHVVVEELQRSAGAPTAFWDPVIEEQGGVDFEVVEATGRLAVRADTMVPELRGDAVFQSGVLHEPTQPLLELLARHNRSHRGAVFNRRMRYREGIVEVGETIEVRGQVSIEAPPADARKQGYRDGPRAVAVLRGRVRLTDQIKME